MPKFEAHKQYERDGHTITFNRDMSGGDALSASCITEMDGRKPEPDDAIPEPIKELLFHD